MKMQTLWSGLVASAVLMVSGAAFSGGITTVDQVQDYDHQTKLLWGYPWGQPPLSSYVHDLNTVHAIGPVPHVPDPCHGIDTAFNAVVQHDQQLGTDSFKVYEVLLELMGRFQCNATVTSTGGNGTPIVTVAPAL